jgi:putative peptidoglycan lipid II flippase
MKPVANPRRSGGGSIVRTALLLLPVQVVVRGAEALMPVLLGTWFGRSRSTDLYYFAWAFFQLVGSLVFAAYQDSAVVPILAEAKLAGKRPLETLTGSLLAHTGLLGCALSFGAAIVAMAAVRFEYGGAQLALAARMVPLFAAFLVVLGFRSFFEAWLVVERRYFASPLGRGAGAAVMLGALAFLHEKLGILAVPLGALAGEIVSASVLAFVLFGHADLRTSLNLSRTEPVRRFARLAASEVAGGAVTRVNPVIDQLMAVAAGVAGGGTLLRYSLDVALVPTSILQAVLLPLLLSRFADDVARRNLDGFRANVVRSLFAVTTLLLGAGLLMLGLRRPILKLAFLHGAMDAAGVEQMAELLPYHLLGLAPFGALLVLARAHIALQNSAIMLSMGALNAGLNVGLNAILVRYMGLEGIALATSLVQIVVAVIFFVRLEPGVRRLREAAAA